LRVQCSERRGTYRGERAEGHGKSGKKTERNFQERGTPSDLKDFGWHEKGILQGQGTHVSKGKEGGEIRGKNEV